VQQNATANGNTVTITTSSYDSHTGNGSITIQTQTGNHPSRDNNPGDIQSGNFANSHGAIGNDKGFAIFPNGQTGSNALTSLLGTATYQSLTLDNAISRYAPPCCNDTASYQANIQKDVGVSGGTHLSELSSGQTQSLANGIARIEGYNANIPTTTRTIVIVPSHEVPPF
jgi:hypothetical protein